MSPVPYVSEAFTYPGGGIAAGVPVAVLFDGTVIEAPIYHDSLGTIAPNPIRTNDFGVIEFYAEPGTYDLKANGLTFTVDVVGGFAPGGGDDLLLPFTAPVIVTGTGKAKLYNDSGRTRIIDSVRVTADVVAGSAVTVDVKKNGASLWLLPAGRPTIPPPGGTIKATNMDTTEAADGDYFSCDIPSAGTGSNLVVQILLKG